MSEAVAGDSHNQPWKLRQTAVPLVSDLDLDMSWGLTTHCDLVLDLELDITKTSPGPGP